MQIGFLPFLFADAREILEVLHYFADPAKAILRLGDKAENVALEEGEIVLLQQAPDFLIKGIRFARLAEQGVVRVDDGHQVVHVAIQRPQIGMDKTDRVVQFMGNPRRQLSD